MKKVPSWGIAVAVLGVVAVLGLAGGVYYKKKSSDSSVGDEAEAEPETTVEDV